MSQMPQTSIYLRHAPTSHNLKHSYIITKILKIIPFVPNHQHLMDVINTSYHFTSSLPLHYEHSWPGSIQEFACDVHPTAWVFYITMKYKKHVYPTVFTSNVKKLSYTVIYSTVQFHVQCQYLQSPPLLRLLVLPYLPVFWLLYDGWMKPGYKVCYVRLDIKSKK